MSYVEKNLIPGETVVYKTRLHWIVLLRPILWVCCSACRDWEYWYAPWLSAETKAACPAGCSHRLSFSLRFRQCALALAG